MSFRSIMLSLQKNIDFSQQKLIIEKKLKFFLIANFPIVFLTLQLV